MAAELWGLVGMAARARKIVSGETAILSVKSRKAKLMLLAEDASSNTKKKVQDKCAFYGVQVILVESSTKLSQAVGQQNRMYIAVEDYGLAEKIKVCMK